GASVRSRTVLMLPPLCTPDRPGAAHAPGQVGELALRHAARGSRRQSRSFERPSPPLGVPYASRGADIVVPRGRAAVNRVVVAHRQAGSKPLPPRGGGQPGRAGEGD